MTTCIVCGRETVCDRCAGKRSVHGGSWVGWVPCAVCGGSGLSHTHPRRERDRARRAAVRDAVTPGESMRRTRVVLDTASDPVALRGEDRAQSERAWLAWKERPLTNAGRMRLTRWWHRDVLASLRTYTVWAAIAGLDRLIFRMRMEALRERLATRERPRYVAADPPPRYDAVWAEGVAALDRDARGECSACKGTGRVETHHVIARCGWCGGAGGAR